MAAGKCSVVSALLLIAACCHVCHSLTGCVISTNYFGCCEYNSFALPSNCKNKAGTCYCDEACFKEDDCCDDINDNFCFEDQCGAAVGSYSKKDLTKKCPIKAKDGCYCDALCQFYNDCCDDLVAFYLTDLLDLGPSTAATKMDAMQQMAGKGFGAKRSGGPKINRPKSQNSSPEWLPTDRLGNQVPY